MINLRQLGIGLETTLQGEYLIHINALLYDLLGETGRAILITRVHIYMALKDTPDANLYDLAEIVDLTPGGVRHNILGMNGSLPKQPPPRFWQIPEREGMITIRLR